MRKVVIVTAMALFAIFLVVLAFTHYPRRSEAGHVHQPRSSLKGSSLDSSRTTNLANLANQAGRNTSSPHAGHPRRSAKPDPIRDGTGGEESPSGVSAKGRDEVSRRERDTRSKATEKEVQELLDLVGRELNPWKETGISLEMVERLYCTGSAAESMRIQVVDGRLYVVGENPNFQTRSRAVQLQFLRLQQRYHLPDVDFVLTTMDSCPGVDGHVRTRDGNETHCKGTAPLLVNDKHAWESHCVLVPDWTFGGWPEAYLETWEIVNPWLSAAADARPWKSRKKPLYWRGGDTSAQRSIMHNSEKVQASELMDVRLMTWGAENFDQEFKSLTEHCDFRHLLHLTGRAYSARLKYLLLCGSTVVFPYRGGWEFVEFWTHLLKDRENILYTAEVDWGNMGDPVLDAMKEVAANETWAQSMGAAGKHLAAEILHPDNVARYWMEMLTQYSALQTFKPKVHKDAFLMEEANLRPTRSMQMWERTCSFC